MLPALVLCPASAELSAGEADSVSKGAKAVLNFALKFCRPSSAWLTGDVLEGSAITHVMRSLRTADSMRVVSVEADVEPVPPTPAGRNIDYIIDISSLGPIEFSHR